MMCPRCSKDPHPKDFGHPRRCAFDAEGGTFTQGNWACLTLLALRYRGDDDKGRTYSEDQSLKVLPFDGSFLVLGWYKDRGATEVAFVVDGMRTHPLTLALAEAYLAGDAEGFSDLLFPESQEVAS